MNNWRKKIVKETYELLAMISLIIGNDLKEPWTKRHISRFYKVHLKMTTNGDTNFTEI